MQLHHSIPFKTHRAMKGFGKRFVCTNHELHNDTQTIIPNFCHSCIFGNPLFFDKSFRFGNYFKDFFMSETVKRTCNYSLEWVDCTKSSEVWYWTSKVLEVKIIFREIEKKLSNKVQPYNGAPETNVATTCQTLFSSVRQFSLKSEITGSQFSQ